MLRTMTPMLTLAAIAVLMAASVAHKVLGLMDGYRKRHLRFTRPHLRWAMLVARRADEESGE